MHYKFKKTSRHLGIIPVVMLTILNLKIYRSISAATAAHNILSSAHRYHRFSALKGSSHEIK
jgi:hypothetical protein